MNIKLTTYINDEKLVEERYVGKYKSNLVSEEIAYNDKNNKKIKIFIDKIKESVSIEKDDSKLYISNSVKEAVYSTEVGEIKLKTKLERINKQERNNLIMLEIVYYIIFEEEKQKNKLKILVKRT